MSTGLAKLVVPSSHARCCPCLQASGPRCCRGCACNSCCRCWVPLSLGMLQLGRGCAAAACTAHACSHYYSCISKKQNKTKHLSAHAPAGPHRHHGTVLLLSAALTVPVGTMPPVFSIYGAKFVFQVVGFGVQPPWQHAAWRRNQLQPDWGARVQPLEVRAMIRSSPSSGTS